MTDSVAIIPARSGSKRIPGKNIKCFNGKPMIAHSIEAALRSGSFDRVVVSTDSDEIAEIAAQYGADSPFRRPAELADDHTPTAPVLRHALQWLADHGRPARHACCIYATAPFILPDDLRVGYSLLQEEKCGSTFTVTDFDFPIFRALKVTPSGALEMVWPEHELTRSQDLPKTYHDAGQFYWLDVGRFFAESRIYMHDSRPVHLPRWRVQDIDTPDDWQRAELMHKMLTENGLLT